MCRSSLAGDYTNDATIKGDECEASVDVNPANHFFVSPIPSHMLTPIKFIPCNGGPSGFVWAPAHIHGTAITYLIEYIHMV